MDDLPAELRVPIKPIIQLGGQTYAEIVLREPTVAQMEAVDGSRGVKWTRELVEQVSKVPTEVLAQLGIRTLNTCSEYLTRFTDAGLPTATDSSPGADTSGASGPTT